MSATPSAMDAQNPMSPRAFAMQHRRPNTSFHGCSKISDYEMLGKLGEGTFGEVYRARSKKSNKVFALKKIIMHNEKDGFPITALREIKLLKMLSHKNVLSLDEMAVEHPSSKPDNKRKRPIMYMVTPYMEHDLSGLLENPAVIFTEPQIKCYLLQLLEGLKYLHENNILHRDMKAANLLIDNKGILQIADFGLARHYEGDIPRPGGGGGKGARDYTSLVVTRWYRPPELLLALKKYTTAIDVWGVGCVFGEMLVGKPILAGESDGHQLELIWDLCGTATDETMPGWKELPGAQGVSPRPRPSSIQARFSKYGPQAVSLLRELLKLDWRTRINAMDAMKHPYFTTSPLPLSPRDIPTFEDSHELDRRKYHDRKAALPPAPKGGTVGRGHHDGPGGGNPQFDGADNYGRSGANGRHPPGDRGSRDDRYNDEPRRPAWARDRPPPHGLPPRPPPPADGFPPREREADGYRDRDRDRDRGARPRPREGGGRDRGGGDRDRDRDTYRPPRDEYRRDDDRDRYRDGGYRDRGPGYDDRRSRRSRSRSPRRRDGYYDRS